MNQRIQKLAEQAGMALKTRRLYDDNDPNGYLESDLDFFDNNLEATRTFFEGGLAKFAELIVLEICKELDKAQWDKGEDWVCADGTRIIPQIKEHFGVEE